MKLKPAGTKMNSNHPDELKKRVRSFLAHQRTCIISTAETEGVWTIPALYRPVPESPGNPEHEVDCLVPRWSDVAHHLTQKPKVVLIVQLSPSAGLSWLQIQGTSRPVETPDWSQLLPRWAITIQPAALYLVVRVTPNRIDLVNEDLGWGVQDTLEW
jgi:hypothetical protein